MLGKNWTVTIKKRMNVFSFIYLELCINLSAMPLYIY